MMKFLAMYHVKLFVAVNFSYFSQKLTLHVDGWLRWLGRLPIFTEALIDNHFIYNAQTMPDRRNGYGYGLFKEGICEGHL